MRPGPIDANRPIIDDRSVAAVTARRRRAVGDGRLGVAFSGGVDSSVLLALAARALGPGARGRPARRLPEPRRRRAASRRTRWPASVGVPVVEVTTTEGDDPAYRANGPDRCFHCKNELFTRIVDRGRRPRTGSRRSRTARTPTTCAVPTGPVRARAREHGVLTPLADAGLDKAAVRRIAAPWGCRRADKPAAPCLASRIPHFEEVTPAQAGPGRGRRGGAARARAGRPARPPPRRGRARRGGRGRRRRASPPTRCEAPCVDAVRAAGFRYVALDLAGHPVGLVHPAQLTVASRCMAAGARSGWTPPPARRRLRAARPRPGRAGAATPRPCSATRKTLEQVLVIAGQVARAGGADAVHPGRAPTRPAPLLDGAAGRAARAATGPHRRRPGTPPEPAGGPRRRARRRHLRPARRPRGRAHRPAPRPRRRARRRRRRGRAAPRARAASTCCGRPRDRRRRGHGRRAAGRRGRAWSPRR